MQELFDYVKSFMESEGITCEEDIYQRDDLYSKLQDFMATCYGIVEKDL